jgi:hypothetical protein
MKKVTITIAIIFGLMSMAFLGKGITGMYLIDFKLSPCETDNDCDDTCCKFYNVDEGVCDFESNCNAILQITREEYIRMTNLNVDSSVMLNKYQSIVKAHIEAPAQESHLNAILVGLVLLLLMAVSLLIPPNKKY